jgi:hypothetical protein
MMIEKNHIDENETRIENAIVTLRKYEHTAGFSCKECGNPFDANPPDDVHKFASVYPCWKFDWVERSSQCSRCGKSTKLFWHPEAHKHHNYATIEEIELKRSKDCLGNHLDYTQRMRGY